MPNAVKYELMFYKWYNVNGFPCVGNALNSDRTLSCMNPSCDIKMTWFLALCMQDNPIVLKLIVVVLKWLNDTFCQEVVKQQCNQQKGTLPLPHHCCVLGDEQKKCLVMQCLVVH
jgi:hypothetical protein